MSHFADVDDGDPQWSLSQRKTSRHARSLTLLWMPTTLQRSGGRVTARRHRFASSRQYQTRLRARTDAPRPAPPSTERGVAKGKYVNEDVGEV